MSSHSSSVASLPLFTGFPGLLFASLAFTFPKRIARSRIKFSLKAWVSSFTGDVLPALGSVGLKLVRTFSLSCICLYKSSVGAILA